MPAIHAPSAWDVTRGSRANGGASSITGIDYTHADLAANVWKAATAFTVTIGGAAITCAAGSLDHGTHVFGTIAAVGNNGADKVKAASLDNLQRPATTS